MSAQAGELPLSEVVELVGNAIWRVERARDLHLSAQADPTSCSDDRDAARELFKSAEREFGWQWQNVKRILAEGLK